jgi:transposase-like protein
VSAQKEIPMRDLTDPIFHDATAAREYLEALHWPNGPICPHCGEDERVTRLTSKTARPGLVMCNACRKQFTVTVGTIFEDSKVPLNKWLLAYRLINGGKKGFSAHELHRALGITYKSAWFLAHRIRETMDSGGGHLGGPGKWVEADEAWVGGLAKNRAFRKPAPKKIVMTLVERGGRARSFHVANVTGPTLRGVLVRNVSRDSVLMTDENNAYKALGIEYAMHMTVNHSAGQYGTLDRRKHSNTVENFFSIFKRGVIGTYHHLSEAHLHRYCREFDFRYNTRAMTDAERTVEALKGARGKRLMYRQPSSLAA